MGELSGFKVQYSMFTLLMVAKGSQAEPDLKGFNLVEVTTY